MGANNDGRFMCEDRCLAEENKNELSGRVRTVATFGATTILSQIAS